jgi:hypothetical protein
MLLALTGSRAAHGVHESDEPVSGAARRARAGESRFASPSAPSRARVIGQLFVEGLVVAICGTAAGALLRSRFSRGVLAWSPPDSNGLHLNLRPNWPVFVLRRGIGTIACLVFGLVPALRASQLDPSASMKTRAAASRAAAAGWRFSAASSPPSRAVARARGRRRAVRAELHQSDDGRHRVQPAAA